MNITAKKNCWSKILSFTNQPIFEDIIFILFYPAIFLVYIVDNISLFIENIFGN